MGVWQLCSWWLIPLCIPCCHCTTLPMGRGADGPGALLMVLLPKMLGKLLARLLPRLLPKLLAELRPKLLTPSFPRKTLPRSYYGACNCCNC